jgi:hypothetical protein
MNDIRGGQNRNLTAPAYPRPHLVVIHDCLIAIPGIEAAQNCEQSGIRVSFGDMATSGMSLPTWLFRIVKEGEAKNQDSVKKISGEELFVGR